MTIEIHTLVIRAVVQAKTKQQSLSNLESFNYRENTTSRSSPFESPIVSEADLVSKCTKAVLRQLARLKER
jgi:hypothetical protein